MPLNHFTAIPVHCIYTCDRTLSIKCVNVYKQDDDANYKIQNISGVDIDFSGLVT